MPKSTNHPGRIQPHARQRGAAPDRRVAAAGDDRIGAGAGVGRIVAGVKMSHPCGDPNLSGEGDLALRKKILEYALDALQTDVDLPTIFKPDLTSACSQEV